MVKYFVFIVMGVILFTGCTNKIIIEPIVEKEISDTKQIKANVIGKKTFLPDSIVKDENALINIVYFMLMVL